MIKVSKRSLHRTRKSLRFREGAESYSHQEHLAGWHFKVGNKFSKSFRFSDINYLVASREDKESMFSDILGASEQLDSGATTKITINNHRLNRSDFEESILMPMKQDGLDGTAKNITICSWTRRREQTALRRKSILPLP